MEDLSKEETLLKEDSKSSLINQGEKNSDDDAPPSPSPLDSPASIVAKQNLETHGFEWTDQDYDSFVDSIIQYKGHIPSSRSVVNKWMDIRISFMEYVRIVRPELYYNPEWQDLKEAYKLSRKEFTKEFNIKFDDVSSSINHINNNIIIALIIAFYVCDDL